MLLSCEKLPGSILVDDSYIKVVVQVYKKMLFTFETLAKILLTLGKIIVLLT